MLIQRISPFRERRENGRRLFELIESGPQGRRSTLRTAGNEIDTLLFLVGSLSNRLVVASTCFKQIRPNRRWTYESADGHTINMKYGIDHMLISSKWQGSVLNCTVYIGSDHQLLVAKIRLRLKARKQSQEVKRFDVQKLCDTAVKAQYCADINDRLAPGHYYRTAGMVLQEVPMRYAAKSRNHVPCNV